MNIKKLTINRISSTIQELNTIITDVAKRFEINSFQLWPRALIQFLFGKFSINELRAYASFAPQVLATLPVLVSKESSLAKLGRINNKAEQWQTEDKEDFYKICEQNDIPYPQIYAVIGAGKKTILGDLPEQFISKDKSGAYASGFATFERVGSNHVKINGGTEESLEAVLDNLAAKESILLLQKRLFDHPGLQEIAGKKTLQTLRINTYRDSENNYRLLFWMIKLVVGDNLSDNFTGGQTGNLIAFGEKNSGQLLGARTLHESGVGLTTIYNHPVTGKPLSESCVPLWEEAVNTAIQAHHYFPEFNALGWDVAITADGPSIIEGNAWWDPPTYAPDLMSEKDWRLIFS